jgi:hypothetical protein
MRYQRESEVGRAFANKLEGERQLATANFA